MPIDLNCPHCGRPLRLADAQAGKQAKCPQCRTVFIAPGGGVAAGGGQWHVHAADGQTYGPISRAELDRWVVEGRVSAECQVLREGEQEWRWAVDLFPSLAGGQPAAGTDPFTVDPRPGGRAAAQPGSPLLTEPARRKRLRPHRATTVLVLGILSLVLCGIFTGIPAWILGSADLKDMNAGRMDKSGETNTRVGMILGVISCAISAVVLLFYIILILAAVTAMRR